MRKISTIAFCLLAALSLVYLYSGLLSNTIVAKEQQKIDEDKYDVIIIGAGMAGLAAGDELHKKGHSLLILEARDRVGGRVWTDRSLGLPLDLGAGWIQGSKGNPVAALAKKYDFKTLVSKLDDLNLYDKDGQALSEDEENTLEEYVTELRNYLGEQQEERDHDVPVSVAVDHFIKKAGLDKQKEQALRHIITLLIEGDYGANINELSLLEYNQDKELSGEDLMLVDGYDQIPKKLAKDLPIHLNEAVTSVTYDDSGVTVRTNIGTYQAKDVIVTVPLGVLKSGVITFSPPLPPSKQRAIDRLGMGLIDKVYLKFPKLFWEKDKDVYFIGYISGSTLWTGFMNFYKLLKQPVLLVFNPGEAARKMEKQSDAEIVHEAMDMLRHIYGKEVPEPTGYLVTRWAQDPYTRGAYSYLAVGATGEDYDEMAKPVGPHLHFAGEATNREYPSLVHGAYWSGLRAAKEIKD